MVQMQLGVAAYGGVVAAGTVQVPELAVPHGNVQVLTQEVVQEVVAFAGNYSSVGLEHSTTVGWPFQCFHAICKKCLIFLQYLS